VTVGTGSVQSLVGIAVSAAVTTTAAAKYERCGGGCLGKWGGPQVVWNPTPARTPETDRDASGPANPLSSGPRRGKREMGGSACTLGRPTPPKEGAAGGIASPPVEIACLRAEMGD